MGLKYNSGYDLTIPFSDDCAQFNLEQDVAQTYTVPGPVGRRYSARFRYSPDGNVFVRLNGVPTVPALGALGTEPFNEFRPGDDDGSQRYVTAGDTISMITPDPFAFAGISLMFLD